MATGLVPRDIEPETEVEIYVTSLCLFIGVLLNAIVIGSLTTALASMNSRAALSRGKLQTIEQYLVVRAVPIDLRVKLLDYFVYQYTSSQAGSASYSSSLRCGPSHAADACHHAP